MTDPTLELAVFKAAAGAGADPAALLDSNTFVQSINGLDPGDSDGISAAIVVAVAADERFAATSATAESRLPAPNPAQGASGTGPLDLGDAEYERYFPTNPTRK